MPDAKELLAERGYDADWMRPRIPFRNLPRRDMLLLA
jgi:hypothetical protein